MERDNRNDLYYRMKLNSDNTSDKSFDTNIKFIVEKYIGDEVPEQIQVNNLHDMIIQAYSLFLDGNLHGISIIDKNNNYNGSNALNLFTDEENKIKNETELLELQQEIKLYKDFLKLYKSTEIFEQYKKQINNT